jgi:hypothetical protein
MYNIVKELLTTRKIIVLSIVLILSFFATSLAAYASASFTIGSAQYVNGRQTMQMDIAPYIEDNRTFLPVRYVAVALASGSDVAYDPALQTVNITEATKYCFQDINVTIGSKIMIVNGATVKMDAAPEIINGRACLPIVWIAKAFDTDVVWDANTQTVTLTPIAQQASVAAPALQYNNAQTASKNLEWQYLQYDGTGYSLQREAIDKQSS